MDEWDGTVSKSQLDRICAIAKLANIDQTGFSALIHTHRTPLNLPQEQLTREIDDGLRRFPSFEVSADELRRYRDHVIVHELPHLRLPNHGKLFKQLLSVHTRR